MFYFDSITKDENIVDISLEENSFEIMVFFSDDEGIV